MTLTKLVAVGASWAETTAPRGLSTFAVLRAREPDLEAQIEGVALATHSAPALV